LENKRLDNEFNNGGEVKLLLKYEMLLTKLHGGEKIPKWYLGYAYKRWDKLIIVYTLIPFNFIIQFINYIKFRYNKWRSKPSIIDKYVIQEVKRQIDFYWDYYWNRKINNDNKIAATLYEMMEADRELRLEEYFHKQIETLAKKYPRIQGGEDA
jgi:hypothetical protein